MKKNTVLTVIAFVLLIAAIAVPSILLNQKAGAAGGTGFVVELDSSNNVTSGVIYDANGWAAFKQYIAGGTAVENMYTPSGTAVTTVTANTSNGSGLTFTLGGDLTLNWGTDALDVFKGTLNGARHKITFTGGSFDSGAIAYDRDSATNAQRYSCGGLVDVLSGGRIVLLYVESTSNINVNVSSTNTADYSCDVGVLVGEMDSSALLNKVSVTAEKYFTVTYNGVRANGEAHPYFNFGLVGYAVNASITEVYSRISLYGNMRFTTQAKTTASMAIAGSVNQGNILGYASANVTISDCYCPSGSVSSLSATQESNVDGKCAITFNGTFRVGGIVGQTNPNGSGITVKNCVAAQSNTGLSVDDTTNIAYDGHSDATDQTATNSNVIQSSALGNLISTYSESNYCTTEALNGVSSRLAVSSNSVSNIVDYATAMFAVKPSGIVVMPKDVTDKIMYDIKGAYPGVNGNNVWVVDESEGLSLKWMIIPAPSVAVTSDSGIRISMSP